MEKRQEIANALGLNINDVVCKVKKNDSSDKKEFIYTIENKGSIRKKINFENADIFTKYEFFFYRYSFDDFSIKSTKDRINIKNIIFEDCYFQEINLSKTECSNFIFSNCEIKNVVFDDCVFKEALKINAECVKLGNCDFKGSVMIESEQIKEISSLRPLSEIKGDLIVKSKKPIEKISLKYTSFYGSCIFTNNTFLELDLSHSLFGKAVRLDNCIFNYKVDLSHSYFKSDVLFSNCEFGTEVDVEKTIDLSSITFNGNAKFDESKFNHFVAFHTTSFEKTASFYKCKFYTIPNFSPADFKGILNINNVVWGEKNKGFDFKNVKELVEKAYNSNDTMENVINLRSSFSGMKHKLIEQDNLLDAQNFHKAELYCKEIELKKEKSRSTKKWVEWALLLLYRKISDHHTDLNKILHIMLMVIVSYGVMIVMSEYVFYCTGHVFASFLLACLCFGLSIAILYSLYQVKKCCINWITRAIIYTGIVAILICWPNILNPVLGMSNSSEYKNTRVMKVIDKLTAAELNQVNTELMAWRHIQANIAKSTREQILENKNIIKKNKYLTPALTDIVTAIKQDEVIYATRNSMSVIYLFLLILCVFSLQKTARKNTIVPS